MELTYSRYLHLDQLLTLQSPRSQPVEHDEMLFIIVHQVYELWFKLLLHELEKARADLNNSELYGALATFKRTRMIIKVLVEQVDVVDTLTPLSFNSFRERLEHSSGFQSAQFRELECMLGFKRPDMLHFFDNDPEARAHIVKRLHEPSVVDAFYIFLSHHGVSLPAEIRQRPLSEPNTGNDAVADALLELYCTRPDLRLLFEIMTDVDEGFQEWRYRHIKLVERTIGNKPGTGGSLGVEFLKRTLFRPMFADLWAIRHRM